MTTRRELITLLGGAATVWPFAARAEQGKRMRRVGVLIPLSANDPETQVRNAAFLLGLQQFGWTVGNNVQIETIAGPQAMRMTLANTRLNWEGRLSEWVGNGRRFRQL